ncbi:MAG: ABC transporter permease [Lachnospiraceae bacterium]|jgi:ABC-type dipeptide/oligopeptide/nickel transport system permease subunit|nr:ABC transporter permease [Lachnospiraceae bacterium]
MKPKILLRRMLRSPQFLIGFLIVTTVVLISVFADRLAPMDENLNHIVNRFTPPQGLGAMAGGYVLGTDELGRDILSRVLIGSKISLTIAFVSTLLVAVTGTFLGVIAGYFGGVVDDIVMRATEVTMAIPSMTLGIVIMAIFGPSISNLVLVMVITSWKSFAKVSRNQVMVMRNREFVQASRALGGSGWHIMLTQIMPNVTTPLLIQLSGTFGGIILTEAGLSYLYLGVQLPDPSWGNMIAGGRTYLAAYPWMVIVPGMALMITVLGFNFLGDGLRDILDPKQSR